eukprot:scaffold32195_cov122-Isochrysis_galbana.AAC.5
MLTAPERCIGATRPGAGAMRARPVETADNMGRGARRQIDRRRDEVPTTSFFSSAASVKLHGPISGKIYCTALSINCVFPSPGISGILPDVQPASDDSR